MSIRWIVSPVKQIFEKGAQIDVKTKNGFTPLHVAAAKNNLDVVKFLILNGSQINAKDKCGRTSLHLAAVKKHSDIVKYLMDHVSKVGPKNPPEKEKNIISNLCSICYSPKNDGHFALLPCMHATFCESCCFKFMQNKSPCPTCRKPIQEYRKIFF